MRFGVELHQYLDAKTIVEEVRVAEAAGYDAVWLGDSQLIWRELYVLMGAAALATERVSLGLGVTNSVTRHAAVTASAAMTLQELSDNRLVLGLGRGYTAVKTIGLKESSRSEFTEYVATVRGLCRGDAVACPSGTMHLAFASPERCPPIVVGVSGPRGLELAGEIGDGVTMTGQVGHPGTLARLLEYVSLGRQRSRVKTDRFSVSVGIAAAVHSDASVARAAVKPLVASYMLAPVVELAPESQVVREQMRRQYDYYTHMSPDATYAVDVPDAIVTDFALAGTPEQCRAQCERLFAAGVDEITIRPYALPGHTRANMIESFGQQVIAPLRQQESSAD